MKYRPLVTVIIPTFNYGRYICEAIDSVLASSFPRSEIEVIIIDDGSTDETLQRGQSYGKGIQYLFQSNQGKALATKVGIDHSNGKYIFNLDADDYFLPGKIEKVVNVFESDNDIVHVGHAALCWDTNTNETQTEQLPRWLVGRKIIGKEVLVDFYKKRILFGGGSTYAARAEVLKSCHIPKEVDMYIDEYLVLMTLSQGCSYFIGEPLSVWRQHGKNFSSVDNEKKYTEVSREKAERVMASLTSVLSSVLSEDFDSDIRILYSLKAKVMEIAFKEASGQKSYSDVLELWKQLLATFRAFGKDTFEIMWHYSVINRTLPIPLLQLGRRATRSV